MNARELREESLRLGFDAVGVARAARLDRDAAAFEAWLRRDYHATMAWMARSPGRRSEPETLLAGCKSVIVAAMSYWPGEALAAVPEGRARVALYARGRDYHKVLRGRLRALAAWLDARTGLASRSFVDTGPVLERAWAERAGIGWIGKNANLISREKGSWLLLGEVLTQADIEPDAGPHADFCGTCTACIEACPTGAIVEPGVVDANRCVSHWTIEHRGEIPEEHRRGIGDWIFGCDDCQTVCPWNQHFAAVDEADRFGRRDDLRGLDPEAILAMDEPTFRARYSGTSLMRAKWEGMRRNACVVLANRGDAGARAALERAADDPDPVVRSHATWGVARLEQERSGRS